MYVSNVIQDINITYQIHNLNKTSEISPISNEHQIHNLNKASKVLPTSNEDQIHNLNKTSEISPTSNEHQIHNLNKASKVLPTSNEHQIHNLNKTSEISPISNEHQIHNLNKASEVTPTSNEDQIHNLNKTSEVLPTSNEHQIHNLNKTSEISPISNEHQIHNLNKASEVTPTSNEDQIHNLNKTSEILPTSNEHKIHNLNRTSEVPPTSNDHQSYDGNKIPEVPPASQKKENSTPRPETLPVNDVKGQRKPKRLRFRKYNTNDFDFMKVLGRSGFGKVMLAELKGTDRYFAIKCLKKNIVIEDNDIESTVIERKMLALGNSHPFLCKLFCTFQTEGHLFYAMEYLGGGDLMFHVEQSGKFDQDRARFYAAEIVVTLMFMHKKRIIYRDLKLDNILLDSEGHIRLVDFGMCQLRSYNEECLPSNFCGTPEYMAPEMIKGQQYNQSVDWWSFGVLLYEMLTGQSPYNGTDEAELFWSICNEEVYYPRFLSKEAKEIISLLLQKDPTMRLGMPTCSAGNIMYQPFFKSVSWERIERKLIEPPFKPTLSGPSDVSNFDDGFTRETAVLTPLEPQLLATMDQQQFKGFSYTNPSMTD
ncbi:putative protein kinase C delta type homolog [Limulus polyphemus]|uniref:Uncharacterized protein n=1 Tax=Limulus polyphemus TaxID=6850 RepID=A0ABM1SXP4_LIMPO|nr:putative protein kinase C delta type homolog [Limulus polyphemus]